MIGAARGAVETCCAGPADSPGASGIESGDVFVPKPEVGYVSGANAGAAAPVPSVGAGDTVEEVAPIEVIEICSI